MPIAQISQVEKSDYSLTLESILNMENTLKNTFNKKLNFFG